MASPSRPRVAIVGGESLLGNELRELLADSILGADLKLVGSEEDSSASILSEQGGEPVVITPVDQETLAASRVVFLAGSPASTAKALERLPTLPPLLIDLTYGLEDKPEARLRGPAAEPSGYRADPAAVLVVAHPAAIVLACLLRRMQARSPIVRAVATVLEPASERGREGINELHQQTIDLLSFRAVGKRVFDAQLSFNVLAAYGEEAPAPLEAVTLRIERHLATLLALGPPVPMPSLRVVQAPVMHGHSISLWVEQETEATAGQLCETLKGGGIDLYPEGLEPPNVVGFAGQNGIAVGAVEQDRNNHRAAWYWAVADNFRITAENAIAAARSALIEASA